MTPSGHPPDDGDGQGGGFLSRWSRLKRQPDRTGEPDVPVAAADQAVPPAGAASDVAGQPETPADRAVAAQAEAEEQERQTILARLPAIESITASTDVTGFMHRLVPHALRNAALRAAWTADPGIRDFLNDAREYALDYNTPGMAPGYGPLTESDDVQAMVSQIFGRPVDKSLTFLPEEGDEQPAQPCGSESQADVEAADAATQQEALPVADPVSVRLSDPAKIWNDSKDNSESCLDPQRSPSDAALQHDPEPSPQAAMPSVPLRRRGGRATPA